MGVGSMMYCPTEVMVADYMTNHFIVQIHFITQYDYGPIKSLLQLCYSKQCTLVYSCIWQNRLDVSTITFTKNEPCIWFGLFSNVDHAQK